MTDAADDDGEAKALAHIAALIRRHDPTFTVQGHFTSGPIEPDPHAAGTDRAKVARSLRLEFDFAELVRDEPRADPRYHWRVSMARGRRTLHVMALDRDFRMFACCEQEIPASPSRAGEVETIGYQRIPREGLRFCIDQFYGRTDGPAPLLARLDDLHAAMGPMRFYGVLVALAVGASVLLHVAVALGAADSSVGAAMLAALALILVAMAGAVAIAPVWRRRAAGPGAEGPGPRGPAAPSSGSAQ